MSFRTSDSEEKSSESYRQTYMDAMQIAEDFSLSFEISNSKIYTM
ncbi:hypothetical protein [Mucilaginibacter glaciei]|nr:hypothetical protein [Mucilaginibacter glaciei]